MEDYSKGGKEVKLPKFDITGMVTVEVPVGSFISPPGDLFRRLKAAEDYLDSCRIIGDADDSGWEHKDVMEAIKIAAGLTPKSEM